METTIFQILSYLIFRQPSQGSRQLHRSKNNHRKIIVIGQLIGSGHIDSFVCIESIILSMHYPNLRNESMFESSLSIQNDNFMINFMIINRIYGILYDYFPIK